jgi:hypothetical protein
VVEAVVGVGAGAVVGAPVAAAVEARAAVVPVETAVVRLKEEV